MPIIKKGVFYAAFVFFCIFLISCQQKQYTQHEDELASGIVNRLSKAEKGSLIVFKETEKIEIIFSPNLGH